MADAAIAIWNSKFLYNYERPIQYIRRNFDSNWKTNLTNPQSGQSGLTPPFPAYPSGHSGFGGSAAGILASTFGNQYTFTDNCHKDRTDFNGAPRTFYSFSKMAEEDAYSRLPLGVHFRMDCDEGLRLGYLAAQRVQQLPWRS
ncbi:MAG: vanadium-dependent haloperoxidase [Saprospiraceae bacterium]|nr:vanadium-dependent haloperoxidase [Saprospiraceae bacterium]